MIDYMIITGTNRALFEQAIKRELENGWQLQGGISYKYRYPESLGKEGGHYAQALVRKEGK